MSVEIRRCQRRRNQRRTVAGKWKSEVVEILCQKSWVDVAGPCDLISCSKRTRENNYTEEEGCRVLRHCKGSFINCVTRDTAIFRAKFTHPPPVTHFVPTFTLYFGPCHAHLCVKIVFNLSPLTVTRDIIYERPLTWQVIFWAVCAKLEDRRHSFHVRAHWRLKDRAQRSVHLEGQTIFRLYSVPLWYNTSESLGKMTTNTRTKLV